MEIEAPTFNSLNTPQKRALILRDQLRWLEPHHLDTFIEGLANPEPPHYKKTNSITKPDLVLVTLKESASRFDLGNVIFPEEDSIVLHAYLVLEGGKIETLSRLQALKTGSDEGSSSSALKHWRREPNTPVTPHITNNRPIVGLSSIPASLKAATFAAIPEQIKIDLFNNIASTAFPNFENLMIASWNVVSVYSACGSDFPEMHKAVVELKDVLQDFNAAFGAGVSRTPVQYRSDWSGEAKTGSGAAKATQPRTEVAESSKTASQRVRQQDQDTETTDPDGGEHLSGVEQDLPASNQGEDSESDSDFSDDFIPARRPSTPDVRQKNRRRDSPAVEASPPKIPQRIRTPSTSLPLRTPSVPPPVHSISTQSQTSRAPNDSDQSAELIRRRQEWASSQSKANKNVSQKSPVAETLMPVPVQKAPSPTVNDIAATPSAARSSPIAAQPSPFLTRTSPAPHATTSSPTPAIASSAPPAVATTFAAALNKRKAAGSPAPGAAKKKLLSDMSTASIQDKARTARVRILRQWNSFDPAIVPRQFLGLYNSLQAELERRGHGDNTGAASKDTSSPTSTSQHDSARDHEQQQQQQQTMDNRPAFHSTQRAPLELQKRIEERARARRATHTPEHSQQRTTSSASASSTPGHAEPAPSCTSPGTADASQTAGTMSGLYLGKSVLGPKKPGGIAPVAPMFGTGVVKGGDGGGGTGGGTGTGTATGTVD
ncbi:hypothetical protein J1614_004974 [Plenodomus biglobosus]|nr:hypothetical protein J1614_004974 [Plenodomus biglobosus]